MSLGRVFNLTYKDGHLYRKGKRAGGISGAGYWMVSIDNKKQYCHRIIWEMHHGPIPEGMCIDHINRDKTDNRIENLRCVSHQRNIQNNGSKGVFFEKARNLYRAHITWHGRYHTVGRYVTEAEAVSARAAFKQQLQERDRSA